MINDGKSGSLNGNRFLFRKKENIASKKNMNFRKRHEFPKNTSVNDESDINLLMIFGMEDEAKNKNPDKYIQLKKKLEEQKSIGGRQEYLIPQQRGEMLKKYSDGAKSAGAMMIPFVFMVIICAVFEYFVFYNRSFAENVVSRYDSAVIPLCAMQFLLIICALGYRRFFHGFGFFTGNATPDSVFTLFSVAAAGYYLYLALTDIGVTAHGAYPYPLFLTPYSIGALMGAVYGAIDEKRLRDSFEIISGDGEKSLLCDYDSAAKRHHGQKKNQTALHVDSTRFVSDFVSRSDGRINNRGLIVSLIVMSLIISLSIGFYIYYTAGNFTEAFSSAFTVLSFTAPFSLYITYSLIPGAASMNAKRHSCAILGDRTFEEYSQALAVYFEDSAVFPPSKVRMKGFNAFGENKVDDSLYILASVYKKIKAPASILFEQSIGGREISEDVNIIDVSEYGLHCSVDGRSVYLGSAAYMRECGCDVYGGENEASPYSILYLAPDRRTSIKVYLDYTLDKNIMSTVASLKKYGMYLGITSADPCINNIMINSKIPVMKYPVGLMKIYEKRNDNTGNEKKSSGIVSAKGTDNLLRTLLSCVRAYSSLRADSVIRYFVLLAGGAISALLIIFGGLGEAGTFYTALYQIAAVLPTALILAFMRN